MAGSPFAGKSGATATANKPAQAAPTAGPKETKADPTEATNVGEDAPIGSDPYADEASDPGGVSGLKPIAFMGQLVLLHCTETGRMKTSTQSQDPDGKSPYAKFDLIPLTVPQPGTPSVRTEAVMTEDGEVAAINKDGEVELFEAYAVNERIDDLLFFNKPLVREGERQQKRGINWSLGRITLGEKKVGQSPPVILQAGSDEDKAFYQQWRAERRSS